MAKDFTTLKPQFNFLYTEEHIRNKVLVACRGGGKTVAVTQYVLNKIAFEPGLIVAFFGQSFNSVESTIWDVLSFYIDYWETNDIAVISHNGQKHEYEFDFGDGEPRRLKLGSYAHGDKSRGMHPNMLVLDECGLMPFRLFERVIDPMIAHMGNQSRSIFLGTPNGKNTFYRFYEIGLEGLKDEIPNWKSYTFKASDSGLLDIEFIKKKQMEMPEEVFRQEYECDFSVSSTAGFVYSALLFQMQDRINDQVVYDPFHPVYVAMDLGRNDYFCAWFFQNIGNSVRFIDYYQGTGAYIAEHAAGLLDKGYPICYSFVPHDGVYKNIATISTVEEVLANHNLRPILLNRTESVHDGIVGVKQMLLSAHFNKTKCDVGLENLREYQVKTDPMFGQATAVPIHHSPFCDAADALRYVYESRMIWSYNS
jgi:hypothetical protein